MATEALELALELDLPAAASVASNIRGVSRTHLGEVEQGVEDLERAEELAKGDNDALLRFRVNYSDSLNLMGRYDESVAVAEKGLERARELGVERSSGAIMATDMIDPLFNLGEWERASLLIERIIALSPPLTFRVYLLQSKVWSTLWRGEIKAAARMFRQWSPHMIALAQSEVQTNSSSPGSPATWRWRRRTSRPGNISRSCSPMSSAPCPDTHCRSTHKVLERWPGCVRTPPTSSMSTTPNSASVPESRLIRSGPPHPRGRV